MGSVSWSWKRLKNESLYGSRSYETNNDFSSERDAKNALNTHFASQECGKCGSRDLNGENIVVEITKIDLHHEVREKGFFGGEKIVDKYLKTVYRVGDIVFPPSHIFSSGGHLKCRKCKHRMGSLGFFAQWAANISRGN